jgi:hypothetical protein
VVSLFKVNQSNGRISGVICHPAIKNDSSAIVLWFFEIPFVLVRLDHVALADKKRAGSKSLPNQLTDPYIIILA